MLYPQGLSSFSQVFTNWDANPAVNLGTTVTPGASNAEGTFTQVASSANIASDVYGFSLIVNTGSLAAASKCHLLDIGVDPAGGTSYTPVISNIPCGESSSVSPGTPHIFLFPFFIKAGSSVAVRVQGNNATAGTIKAAFKFYGNPSRPEAFPVGRFAETIGAITNSNGVSFTPGNAADGTWVSLGTTTKPLWWWQLGYQIDNATITAEQTYIDLAFGDASNKHLITRIFHAGTTTEIIAPAIPMNLNFFECYKPVPAGAEIWVRGRCNNAPDTGYNAVAIGIGG